MSRIIIKMDDFDIDKVIRLNLKRILKERKLTPKKFATIIKKPASQVSNWLSDPEKTDTAKPPGKKLIKEICKKADIDIVEFYDLGVIGYSNKNSSQKNVEIIENERNLYRELSEERKKRMDMLEKENQELKNKIELQKIKALQRKRRDDPDEFDPSGLREQVHELFKV